MYQSWEGCQFFMESGKCNHLDRGRGFLWRGKRCILLDNFPSECEKRVARTSQDPPPPLPIMGV